MIENQGEEPIFENLLPYIDQNQLFQSYKSVFRSTKKALQISFGFTMTSNQKLKKKLNKWHIQEK